MKELQQARCRVLLPYRGIGSMGSFGSLLVIEAPDLLFGTQSVCDRSMGSLVWYTACLSWILTAETPLQQAKDTGVHHNGLKRKQEKMTCLVSFHLFCNPLRQMFS